MAFYLPLGDGRFSSTEHTAGPWNRTDQHLGPPSALLGRAMEALPASHPATLVRVTVEILGPVPVGELAVSASVLRPGRTVELLSAELVAGDRAVARANAWRIASSDSTGAAAGELPPPGQPEQGEPIGRPDNWCPGYLDAMEWRSLHGRFDEPGPATIWVRQRVPLVEGEQPSPLQRLLTVADSGNGASARLDPTAWWFINPELSVHLNRLPDGEWICLDASTVIGPNGTGTASSVLYDRTGAVATGAQSLLVRPR